MQGLRSNEKTSALLDTLLTEVRDIRDRNKETCTDMYFNTARQMIMCAFIPDFPTLPAAPVEIEDEDALIKKRLDMIVQAKLWSMRVFDDEVYHLVEYLDGLHLPDDPYDTHDLISRVERARRRAEETEKGNWSRADRLLLGLEEFSEKQEVDVGESEEERWDRLDKEEKAWEQKQTEQYERHQAEKVKKDADKA